MVVASHKGGTGKTTTAVTIGHRLAQLGQRVLLVDLDPQGNLSDFLGRPPAAGVYRMLVERVEAEDVIVQLEDRPGLDLLPGDHSTARAAKLLTGEAGLDFRLKKALAGLGYDWVLIDTAPSLGVMQLLAFVAGDWLLVPTELAYASGLGVGQVLRTVAQLKKDVDTRIKLAGILPTKWDRRLTDSDAQLKALKDRFPKKVWLPIPTDAKAAEAPAFGSTLWEYAPKSRAVVGLLWGAQLVGGYAKAVERLLREVG